MILCGAVGFSGLVVSTDCFAGSTDGLMVSTDILVVSTDGLEDSTDGLVGSTYGLVGSTDGLVISIDFFNNGAEDSVSTFMGAVALGGATGWIGMDLNSEGRFPVGVIGDVG